MNWKRVFVFSLFLSSSVLASDVTGDWIADRRGPSGEARSLTLHLHTDGSTLTGTVSGFGGSAGDAQLTDGSVSGDQLSFTVNRGQFKMSYEGKIVGDGIQLKLKRDAADTAATPNSGTEEWTAHRAGS